MDKVNISFGGPIGPPYLFYFISKRFFIFLNNEKLKPFITNGKAVIALCVTRDVFFVIESLMTNMHIAIILHINIMTKFQMKMNHWNLHIHYWFTSQWEDYV